MSLPRLQAPKEHGQVLAVPALAQFDAHFLKLLRERDALRTAVPHVLNSYPWDPDAQWLARNEVIAASRQYLQDAGQDVPKSAADVFWFVAGHQPELFHPGVWIKNFALHQLACKYGGASLNLIIDTDIAKPAVLRAPDSGRLVQIAFDRSTEGTPYEERVVEDERLFAELPERMAPITAHWPFEPMLEVFWREVMAQSQRTPLLGERLASARRTVERRWGMVQHEIPMSRVCQTRAFAQFALWILANLAAFHQVYNQVVAAYRREHGIRSRNHPVPDLAQDGDWLEAPFWAWRRGQARRDRLLVRQRNEELELRVHGEAWPSVRRSYLQEDVQAWQELERQELKVRSRALTTTMFARLLLADVFIHGIGGGIYDELTDRIVERLCGWRPPPFLILSATLMLPLPRYLDALDNLRSLERRQRELTYKPERFVAATSETAALTRAKFEWIARGGAAHAERVERFARLRELNVKLQPFVLAQLQHTRAEKAESQRQAHCDAAASRRDYAFCLYPEEMLREFFMRPLPT